MSIILGMDILFLIGGCTIIPPHSPGDANSSRMGKSHWALLHISSSHAAFSSR